jgi:hypothetical protein
MALETITGTCSDLLFGVKRRLLGQNHLRRTRLYGVGTGKTGTHSIAAMFSGPVRSRHEPESIKLMEKIFALQAGRIKEEELKAWVRRRDRKLALEVDSSHLNFYILDMLIREFPEARFVLTIRDCYSWCNSVINQAARLAGKVHAFWPRLADLRFRPEIFRHAPEEKLLKEKGLYTLDGYLSHWNGHNGQVIEKVPKERLLVVRTDQIQQEALTIASFAGLPHHAVCLERTHEYQNPSKEQWLRQIDRNFLEAKVEKHCRPLMTRFFPEIKSLDDAKL